MTWSSVSADGMITIITEEEVFSQDFSNGIRHGGIFLTLLSTSGATIDDKVGILTT